MVGEIKFLSLNIGMSESLASLMGFMLNDNLDIIFLQEVRLSSDQLRVKLGSGYKVEDNVSEEDSSKPGTVITWKSCFLLLMLLY